jgi:hypothetical protein
MELFASALDTADDHAKRRVELAFENSLRAIMTAGDWEDSIFHALTVVAQDNRGRWKADVTVSDTRATLKEQLVKSFHAATAERGAGAIEGRLAHLLDDAWSRGIRNLFILFDASGKNLSAHDRLTCQVEAAKWDQAA